MDYDYLSGKYSIQFPVKIRRELDAFEVKLADDKFRSDTVSHLIF